MNKPWSICRRFGPALGILLGAVLCGALWVPADTIHARVSLVFSPDTDNDRLTDAAEAWMGTSANDRDSDDDGLSDGDESFDHKTDPLDADSDDDGMGDGAEVFAGTQPTNAQSLFIISSVTPGTGGTEVVWTTVDGRRYLMETKNSLFLAWTNPLPSWIEETDESPEGTEMWFDTATTSAPARYYRVRVLPAD